MSSGLNEKPASGNVGFTTQIDQIFFTGGPANNRSSGEACPARRHSPRQLALLGLEASSTARFARFWRVRRAASRGTCSRCRLASAPSPHIAGGRSRGLSRGLLLERSAPWARTGPGWLRLVPWTADGRCGTAQRAGWAAAMTGFANSSTRSAYCGHLLREAQATPRRRRVVLG